jgi:hypothetical protein
VRSFPRCLSADPDRPHLALRINVGAALPNTVLAHFGAMFFKLVVSCFDDTTLAYQAAAQFLNVLKSITN